MNSHMTKEEAESVVIVVCANKVGQCDTVFKSSLLSCTHLYYDRLMVHIVSLLRQRASYGRSLEVSFISKPQL